MMDISVNKTLPPAWHTAILPGIRHHHISAPLQRNYPFSIMIRDYVCCVAAHEEILNTHQDENNTVLLRLAKTKEKRDRCFTRNRKTLAVRHI